MLRGNKQFTPKLPIFHLVDFKIHRYLSMLCLTWLHMLQDAQCCLNDWAILALWERWIHSEMCLYWESLTALKVPVAGTSLAVGQHDQAVRNGGDSRPQHLGLHSSAVPTQTAAIHTSALASWVSCCYELWQAALSPEHLILLMMDRILWLLTRMSSAPPVKLLSYGAFTSKMIFTDTCKPPSCSGN